MNLEVTDSILRDLESSVCVTSGLGESESGTEGCDNQSIQKSFKTGKFGATSDFDNSSINQLGLEQGKFIEDIGNNHSGVQR